MPYTGTLNLDDLMCGLKEIGFNGYFDFEVTALKTTDRRREFEKEKRLAEPTVEMQDIIERFMYCVAKQCLQRYDCFEE
jgi:hypothetical protein